MKDRDAWIAKAQTTAEMCRLVHGIDCRLIGCAGNTFTQTIANRGQIDRLATGPDPRAKAIHVWAPDPIDPNRSRLVAARLAIPANGMRCPRCHGRAPRSDGIPCALCAPECLTSTERL